jgi:hypothetical protein
LPIAITDEQLALQASIREWAKRTGTIDLVRGQEPGTDDAPDDDAAGRRRRLALGPTADDSELATARNAAREFAATVLAGPAGQRRRALADSGYAAPAWPVPFGLGAPRHKGITYFLVRMGSPGIDIRPLREITGREMFNQIFLDQVFVPDDCVVGQVGDGWRVTRTTLASERGLVSEFLLTRCLSIAGSSTQIRMSVVAERLLGLPREEAR